MSNENRVPNFLGYIGDYTTRLYGDYKKPCIIRIQDPKKNNQDPMVSSPFLIGDTSSNGSEKTKPLCSDPYC